MSNQQNAWPEERIARCKFLWMNTNISARAIGEDLGITRNAVIGKLHRLGLNMENRPPQEGASLEKILRLRRLQAIQKRTAEEDRSKRLAKRRKKWAEKKEELASLDGGQQHVKMPNGGAALTVGYLEPKDFGPSNPIGQRPLLSLAKGECRWPSGHGTIAEPFTFCGATQAEGSSYCPRHSDEAYGPYVRTAHTGFYPMRKTG